MASSSGSASARESEVDRGYYLDPRADAPKAYGYVIVMSAWTPPMIGPSLARAHTHLLSPIGIFNPWLTGCICPYRTGSVASVLRYR